MNKLSAIPYKSINLMKSLRIYVKFILLAMLFMCIPASNVSAQETKNAIEPEVEHIEVNPEFPPCVYKNRKGKKVKNPGGQEGVMKYLSDVLEYPEIALESGISGTVKVGFIINEDGSIGDVKVLSSPDPILSKEAIRVVSMMPAWKPGTRDGKPVKVGMTVPIKFYHMY